MPAGIASSFSSRVRRIGFHFGRVIGERLIGQRRDERCGASLDMRHILNIHVALALCRIRAIWIRITSRAFAIQHHQPAVGQRARRGRIPAGGNEAEHHAPSCRNVHHCRGVRIGANDVQTALIGTQRQRAGRHAKRMIGSRGNVDGLHHAQVAAIGNTHRVNVVGIRSGRQRCEL